MSFKHARDRIAFLRDVILRLDKTEDPALDSVMKANLGRLLLEYIGELEAGVSAEPPLPTTPDQPEPAPAPPSDRGRARADSVSAWPYIRPDNGALSRVQAGDS